MAFTPGPVELERWVKQGQPVNIVDVTATAAVEFTKQGYPVMELDGGWRWWKDDGFEIAK